MLAMERHGLGAQAPRLVWTGVVMIERPDMTRHPHVPFGDGPLCWVRSARTLTLNGRRAIVMQLPYRMLRKYFRSSDLDHCFVWAELFDIGSPAGGHLELKERACLADWVNTATPAGVNG